MTTETHSDSKFYYGNCLCKNKIISTSTVAIQCEHCINSSKFTGILKENKLKCLCKDIVVAHELCNICAGLRDNIDLLHTELDTLSCNMITEIKMYMNCNDKLNRIKEISIELRHLNRQLLKNLDKKITYIEVDDFILSDTESDTECKAENKE